MNDTLKEKIADLLEDEVLPIVKKKVESGADPMEILHDCQAGVEIVGERYSRGTYFIADLMIAGEIFKQVNAILLDKFGTQEIKTKGNVVFGTVQEDIHDIGKDLVVGILRSVGYEVTDLGVDVPKERFIEAVHKSEASVLCLSGLLTGPI